MFGANEGSFHREITARTKHMECVLATRSFTGNPSQIIVEQLVASGIRHVFYNSGSREARFFDSLHGRAGIDGILGLHEGAVTSMAGGFAQVNSEPAVMSVHLGAGLAQSLGQAWRDASLDR